MKTPALIQKNISVIDHAATGTAARAFRLSLRLSLREVARRLSVSAPYVSNLELGRANWDAGRLAWYTAALKPKPPESPLRPKPPTP